MSKALLVMLMLSAATSAFADQSTPAPLKIARFGALRPAQSDPYQRLFEWKGGRPPAIATKTPEAKRQVVCGMTIIPVDSKIDPQMLITPKSDGIDYKIRAIDRPICSPAR